jgi:hypothetical protein
VALYYLPDSPVTPRYYEFDYNRTVLDPSGTFGFGIPGVFNLGTRTAPTATPGGFGWFMVRAWETAFGSTYEQALQNAFNVALVGQSEPFRVDLGDPTSTPAGTPASMTAAGFRGFCVSPEGWSGVGCVPEPSMLSLGLAAASALLLLRSRRL